jgi:hypothetical protein
MQCCKILITIPHNNFDVQTTMQKKVQNSSPNNFILNKKHTSLTSQHFHELQLVLQPSLLKAPKQLTTSEKKYPNK